MKYSDLTRSIVNRNIGNMNNKDQIKIALLDFIKDDKFKTYQHLQPAVENSTAEDKAFVTAEMNACCGELLQTLEGPAVPEDKLREIVRASLERIKDQGLDTEDEEFCYELYAVIGDILGIDIQDHSITGEEIFLKDMQKLAKMAGIDLSKLIPPKQ